MLNIGRDTDAMLFEAITHDNEQAFATLYDRYWCRLLAVAYAVTKEQNLAEEVVQEVFVSLWQRRQTVSVQNLEQYLATAVKFSAFKAMQRRRRHHEIESGVISMQPQSVASEEVDAKFLREYMNDIVENLPEKCQIVFKMSRESYLTNKEIADNLNISQKSVESHITRALKVLKLGLRRAGYLFFMMLFL